MKKESAQLGNEGIYDVKQLGLPRTLLLGLQHMFAMFGATVLVPIITGLDVATTLLMAGLGTLLFHLITGGKVPAFLGSSFAFLGGYAAVCPKLEDGSPNTEMIPYACLGVFVAGLVYALVALLVKVLGVSRVMRFFPPVVTGPIIISIGLILAPSAVNNIVTPIASGTLADGTQTFHPVGFNWIVALSALLIIVIFNIWGKGMAKIVPIVIGIVVSYLVAVVLGIVDFTAVKQADIIGLPLHSEQFMFGAFKDGSKAISAIITMAPISLATMMEHIGDISAIGATAGRNYIAKPGLHRTLLGDGLATSFAAMFGGPANTTYGENTGVLALTKVFDPRVMQIAAVFAILLSFFPKFSAAISTIPAPIIGVISFILYGMISAIGVRNVVENQVDFTKSRNLIIAAVILVSALGFNGIGGVSFTIGSTTITLSGLAIAAIVGILLNALLPGKDYNFSEADPKETGVNFEI